MLEAEEKTEAIGGGPTTHSIVEKRQRTEVLGKTEDIINRMK